MEISQHIWDIIDIETRTTQHGTVALIVQDGRLIQLDKTEKIRFSSLELANPKKLSFQPGTVVEQENLRRRISEILSGLRFGQVVIVLKDGKVVQIERIEKHRVTSLEGLFGEGI